MAEVSGTCDERFEAVRQTFEGNLESGADVGASVAVALDGELVVDLWGGWADEDRTRPWQRDTIANVWSTTKTMTFVCCLILADRGELDLDAPVATYWPEFAAEGKDRVAVRHLLSHTAGLSGWDAPMRPEDLADWDRATAALAAQAPWWEPGSASGYHAVTQGFLLGEVVRRITGVSIGAFFAQEVARPLGADFHIGLPESEDHRVASLVPPPPIDLRAVRASDVAVRTFSNPPLDATQTRHAWWRRAEIPAANGHGNARSVALVQSVVAGGGEARGVRLFGERTSERIFEEQSYGTDLVLGVPLRFGMGYGLRTDLVPIGPRACYWGGYGGSVVVMDLDARLTVCYVMNRMESGLVGDPRGMGLVLAAAGSLTG
ncbi:MAG: serine hydrolase [Actinomycetota bacterium]|nr:serine hydrolase [Actinomycetota bacterium]MDA8294015.1 serine hydrolase [Actinomycetota bacterium]